MKKREIYTNNLIQAIRRKYATVLARYAAITVLFVVLCVAFCLLATFDLVNLYVCCAINVVLTIAFLWLSYLFFTICLKKAREKSTFVKCLENAYPSVYGGKYVGFEQDEQYLTLLFEDGNKLRLDSSAANCFIVGKKYLIDVVDGVVISYGEVEDE